MLFQPSHITPSTLTGSAAVDATNAISIGWQINGNSVLTAYSLKIYRNVSGGSPILVYSGTKQTAIGNKLPGSMFSTSVRSSAITNGSEYLLYITQYWSENGTEKSLTTTVPAVFVASATPQITLSGSNFQDTTNGWYAVVPNVAFLATITATEPVEKIRWTVTKYPGLYDSFDQFVVDDTGYVYTQDFTYTPPVLSKGNYICKVEVVMASGISAELSQGFVINCLTLPFKASEYSFAVIDDAYATFDSNSSSTAMTFMQTVTQPVALGNSSFQVGANGKIAFNTMTRNGLTLPLHIPANYSFMWSGMAAVGTEIFALNFATGTKCTATVLSTGIEFSYNEITFEVSFASSITGQFSGEVGLTWMRGGVSFYFVATNNTDKNSYDLEDDADEPALECISFGGMQTCNFFKLTLEQFSVDGNSHGSDALTIMYSVFGTGEAAIAKRDSLLGNATDYWQDITSQRISPISLNTIWNFKALNKYVALTFVQNTFFVTSEFCLRVNSYMLLEAEHVGFADRTHNAVRYWKFGNNLSTGEVGNGNTPSMLTNFTRYRLPQKTSLLGKTGSLSALLSNVSESEYSDSAAQMETLYEASVSTNDFFLRDTKGNFYQVTISAPIKQSFSTSSLKQQVTISVNWEETGDASTAVIGFVAQKAN